MSDYKNLEQVVGRGTYHIRVAPKSEFDAEGNIIEGSHKNGKSEKGNKWWLYSILSIKKYDSDADYQKITYEKDGKDAKHSAFANEGNKVAFDTGEVEVDVVERMRNGVNEKAAFYKEVGSKEKFLAEKAEVKEKLGVEDEIKNEDIPS